MPKKLQSDVQTEKLASPQLEQSVQTAARGDSDNLYQALFEHSGAAIYLHGIHGNILDSNQAASQQSGYSREELLEMRIFDLHPESLPGLTESAEIKEVWRSWQIGEHINLETKQQRKDGSIFPVELSTAVIQRDDQKLILITVLDISNRKSIENNLRESEAKFRSLYEEAPISYQSLDAEGRFLKVNQAWLDTLGYHRDEVIGRSFSNFLHPDWRQHFADNFPRFKSIGEVLGVEFEMIKKDGSAILVSFNGKIARDEHGRFQQTHCILEDITEKRKAESRIRESERKYRELAENLPDAIYRMSLPDGQYEYMSSAASEIFGYSPEEFYGSPMLIREIIHPAWHDYFAEKWQQLLDGLVPPTYEYQIIHRNGDTRWLHQRNVGQRDDSGRLTAIEGVVTDTTLLQKAQEALKESERRFAMLLENVPGYIYLQARDHSIRYANQYFTDQFGEPGSRKCYEIFYTSQTPCEECHTFSVFETGKPLIREMLGAPDGRDYQVYDYPFVDIDGTELVLEIGMDITDLKTTERALEQSNLDLKLAQFIANMGNWLFDPETATEQWSEEVYRIYERDPNAGPCDLDDYEKLFEKDHFQRYLSAQKLAVEKGLPHDIELLLIMPDGREKWVNIICQPEKFPGPKGHKLRGTIQDITREKQSALFLRNSEQRFRKIVEQCPLSIVITDENQEVLFHNDKFTELFGYTLADIRTAEHWWEKAYPDADYRKVVQESWQNAVAEAKSLNRDIDMQEWEITTKDGAHRTVEFYMVPLDDIGVIIMNDITERKRIENDLLMTKGAIENSLNGFDIVGEDGLFVYVNKAYAEMWGYNSAEEIIGTSPTTHCEDPSMVDTVIQTLREKGEYEFELRARRKDGSLFDVLMYARLAYDQFGREIYPTTSIDITEKKTLEEKLQRAQKLESIGNLAGGIAHEFNNILSIIIGNNELIMDDLPKWSFARESADEIRVAGLRARDIVKQLLTFSRQDSSTKQVFDLRQVIVESLKLLKATIPTNISIATDIAEKVHPIYGSETQMNQILINLCKNSADAIVTGVGTITISLHNCDKTGTNELSKQVCIQVKDTGTGMGDALRQRIFDPYFTTKEVGKGTGIGLSVVHGIVESHGGTIEVESTPQSGTTFTIILPAAETDWQESETAEYTIPGGDEHILFVDDEPTLCLISERRLSSLGYAVTTATDPATALAIYTKNPDMYDLVITDMAMPGMTGDKLLARVKELRPDIPTILCTGYSETLTEEQAFEMGIDAYLGKPVEKEKYASTIRAVLDGKTSAL